MEQSVSNMNNVNFFEFGTRYKLLFPYKGSISIEDLWDLKPEELDSIYRELRAKQQRLLGESEDTLLGSKGEDTMEAKAVEASIGIIKQIVSVKLAEKEARAKRAENRAQRQKLLEILEARENESLRNMSTEELQKMLNDLGKE